MSTGSRRRRAPIACEKCHLRKVRCNLSAKGIPCANCEQDGVECQIFRPKRTRLAMSTTTTQNIPTVRASLVEGLDSSLAQLQPAQDSILVDPSSCSPSQPLVSPPESYSRSIHPYPPQDATSSTPPLTDIEDNIREDVINPSAFSAGLEDEESQDVVPFYVGNSQGLEFMLDICRPDRPERNHYLVRCPPAKPPRPEDISYLRENRVFDLPTEELRSELFKNYVYHIHPLLPIVDIAPLLQEQGTGSQAKPSLLLLWSLFSVSAAFLPIGLVRAAGFRSNKEMQHSWYRKAKCLHDVEFEYNKIIAIQSAVLMSHRYADTDDRSGPWHWIGVAISLAHTIGLHRDPKMENPTNSDHPYFQDQIALWRRVWWSCFYRETWLGLSHGRPMRIHLDDCDMPMPATEDMWAGMDALPEDIRRRYFPTSQDCEALSRVYLLNLELSVTLSKVLRVHYRPRPSTPSTSQVEADEEMVLQHARQCQGYLDHPTPIVQSRAVHVLIHFEVLMIVLYRPYLLKPPSSDGTVDLGHWQSSALKKTKHAADNISTILNKLTSLEEVKICDPTIILALRPAMQVYLLLSTSSNNFHQRHALLQLELYMLILREMLPIAWTAGLMIDLFRKAMKRLAARREPAQERLGPSGTESLRQGQNAASVGNAGASIGDNWTYSTWWAPDSYVLDGMGEWPIPNMDESWELALESVLDAEGLLGTSHAS